MLQAAYPLADLRTLLLPSNQWMPYAKAADRLIWEQLPPAVREAQVRQGEGFLHHNWPGIPATLWLDLVRTGNRSRFEDVHFARRQALTALVLAECIEARGRFIDDIINGIWSICEEASWAVSAHTIMQNAGRGLPAPDEQIVDLFAGETASILAWTDYLLRPQFNAVSQQVHRRIAHEIETRIMAPCRTRNDIWWMCQFPQFRPANNWNPWVCSNWLTCVLLLETDAERRAVAVDKILRVLDCFISDYPADGGCDEGPVYWTRAGASLFDCLDLLHSASASRIDIYNRPLIGNIGRFIYRAQIAGRYQVNFADAGALGAPDPILTYAFGKSIADPSMMAMGAWAARQSTLGGQTLEGAMGHIRSMGRILRTAKLLNELTAHSINPQPPLPLQHWFEGLQVLVAREEAGSTRGFFLAAKGGHNAESHNHNDVGQFIVYHDGLPVLIDAGVETYSAKTFGPNRYDIWTMRSNYHNLPTMGGIEQRAGREFAAKDAECRLTEADAQLTLDIAGAYPPEAGLTKWKRAWRFVRGRGIRLIDHYALSRDMTDITLSLLTPCIPQLVSPGRITLDDAFLPEGRRSGKAHLEFEPRELAVTFEVIPIDDPLLAGVWGTKLTRILLRLDQPHRNGEIQLDIAR